MQTTTRCGTPEFFLLSNSSCSLFEDPQNYWQEVRNQVLPKIQTNLNILNVVCNITGLTSFTRFNRIVLHNLSRIDHVFTSSTNFSISTSFTKPNVLVFLEPDIKLQL